MPPPELAEQGVYCSGPECHNLQPKWERSVDELFPPKSCVDPVWIVEGFGRGGTSGGGSAPIHFGDVPAFAEKPASPAKPPTKPTVKLATKPVPEKSAKKGGR
jgi:hypothetical protein